MDERKQNKNEVFMNLRERLANSFSFTTTPDSLGLRKCPHEIAVNPSLDPSASSGQNRHDATHDTLIRRKSLRESHIFCRFINPVS